MDSRRPNRSNLFAPFIPTMSEQAAFSSKNGLVVLKQYSRAGAIAGVFFGCGHGVCVTPD
jgi:hypothetical protein